MARKHQRLQSLGLVIIPLNDRHEKMKAGILKKLEQNPELKQAYQTLVKHLPED